MKTKELFRENVYLKECTAKILEIRNSKNSTLVTLDRTIFFPTGGGQSCDLGTINDFNVTDVYIKDNIIYHALDISKCGILNVGEEVLLKIDWERRFDNMQRHCGEHILSGIFHREYGGVNRGFHMGDDYMTIDISLEDNPDYDHLTWEMVKHVEACANEVIWQNLPVITRYYANKADAENLPLRKKLNIENNITIVSIGSTENPSDCVACCGTHPAYTGQVGLIKIYKLESNKGMYRIYLDAGKRAFLKYQNDFDILNEINKKLSSNTNTLIEKYDKQCLKNENVKSELYDAKKFIIENECKEINTGNAKYEQNKLHKDVNTIIKLYKTLPIDILNQIGQSIIKESADSFILLAQLSSLTLLMFSNSKISCQDFIKNAIKNLDCKGGGNRNSGRLICKDKAAFDKIISSI